MWSIIMIILCWYLYFFIIYHFPPRLTFPILVHEVPLVFFLMQIGNIFILHQKIRIFHITVWTLITLNITVYDILNLLYFKISVCISIKSRFIFTLSQYHSKQDSSSATSCGASISTYFSSICSTWLAQIIFLVMISISSSFVVIPSFYSIINLVESVLK